MIRRLVFIISILICALPVRAQEDVTFPEPTGAFQVGKTTYSLIDESREEVFTEDANDKRELLISVYYPAIPAANATPAPYAEGTLREVLGVPPEKVDQIHPHVYDGASVADGRFPVLVFSPGMGALPLYYTSLLTEIASRGYVVAAVWHLYSAAITAFPDGRIVGANAQGYLDPFLDPAASEAATERIGAIWVSDDQFVLDQLEQLNNDDSLLAGHLDMERAGIFGHSIGGGTAVEAAYEDSRFKAVINMDGPLFGDVQGQGLTQPFMAMFSTEWVITDEVVAAAGVWREDYEAVISAYVTRYTEQLQSLLENTSTSYSFRFSGTAHFTFATDTVLIAPLFPELFPETTVGTRPGDYVVEVVSNYALVLFDHYLKGKEGILLVTESAQYPGVDFQTIHPE